jgi:hypothetical protein
VIDMADARPTGSFQCPGCGKTYALKPSLAGRTVQCKCGQKMIAPKPLGGTATPDARPARPPKPSLADLLDEEGDESHDEPAPPRGGRSRASRSSTRSKPGSNSQDEDTWKWWYYIVVGMLIGAFSVWQLIDGEPIIRFGGRRGGPIGGLLLAALCIAVGWFSRPRGDE